MLGALSMSALIVPIACKLPLLCPLLCPLLAMLQTVRVKERLHGL